MILCSNGSSYFQNSLGVLGDEVKFEDLQKEPWYPEAKEKRDKFISCPNTEAHC